MNIRRLNLPEYEKKVIDTYYVEAYQLEVDPDTQFVMQRRLCRLYFTNFRYHKKMNGDLVGFASLDWRAYDVMRGRDLSMVRFECALTGSSINIPEIDIVSLKQRVQLTVKNRPE